MAIKDSRMPSLKNKIDEKEGVTKAKEVAKKVKEKKAKKKKSGRTSILKKIIKRRKK